MAKVTGLVDIRPSLKLADEVMPKARALIESYVLFRLLGRDGRIGSGLRLLPLPKVDGKARKNTWTKFGVPPAR